MAEVVDDGADRENLGLFHDHPFLSRTVYSWTEPLLAKARRGLLTGADFGDVPAWCDSRPLTERLDRYVRERKGGRGGQWVEMILRLFRCDILRSAANSTLSDLLMWVQLWPLASFLRQLSRLKEAEEAIPISPTLFLYPLGIVLLMLVRLWAISDCLSRIYAIGYLCRSSIMGCLYQKSLRLSNESRQRFSGGKGLNILSGDTNRISITLTLVNFVVLIPVRILTALAIGYYYLGVYAVPGILFILLIIGLLLIMARMLKLCRRRLAKASDDRLGLAQEAFGNIRIIKFLCMETPLEDKIGAARGQELNLLFRVNSLLALATAIDFWAPIFAATLAIACVALCGSAHLEAGALYAFMQAFSSLTIPLMALPMLMGAAVAARVATGRIDEFLLASERFAAPSARHLGPALADADRGAIIQFREASFKWDTFCAAEKVDTPADRARQRRRLLRRLLCTRQQDGDGGGDDDAGEELEQVVTDTKEFSTPFVLSNLNLSIPKGALVGITGASGAGKSSLLAAILGEMPSVGGSLCIGDGESPPPGTISYAQQTAWLAAGTVKENILFGQAYEEARYRSCIEQCQMIHDLQTFCEGDDTIVGGQGSATISGGQRQRINLARAIYAQAQIYLLDDPTSALDARVGRLIFDDCISTGLLAGKTRLVATHQARILSKCDLVIQLRDGEVVWQGRGADYLSVPGAETDASSLQEMSSSESVDDLMTGGCPEDDDGNSMALEQDCLRGTSDRRVMEEENISRNASADALSSYLRAFGGPLGFFILIVLVLASETLKVARDGLLKGRLGAPGGLLGGGDSVRFAVKYALLGTAQGAVSGILTITTVYLCLRAARILHHEAVGKLLRAQLPVFEETPLGRILGRFTGDLSLIDETFPESITDALFCLSALLSLMLLVGIYHCEMLLSLPLPIIATILLQQRFRRAWRQLHQLCNVAMVPVMSHFSESLGGLCLIRVFGREGDYISEFDRVNSRYCYACVWMMSVRRWASLRSAAVWILYWFLMACYCIYARIPGGAAGLLLSYVGQTIDSVDWAMRHLAEIESCFVSVERLHQYAHNVSSEVSSAVADAAGDGGKDDAGDLWNGHGQWPSRGHLVFDQVTIKYSKGTLATIADFTFDFAPGKKIAIVGRSGAGKSTLVGALFR